MSNLITINEFSRKFEEPRWSEKLQKYVSGGFEKEIEFRTANVPQLIQDAVYQNQLRISDNYLLPENEKALIAREVDEYSILAVAANGYDDKCRPLIVYRYFWLENLSDPNFDGVGTLLQWWKEKQEPYCEIKPHQEYINEIEANGKKYYQGQPYYKDHFKDYEEQTEEIFNQITEKPYILKFLEKDGNIIRPNHWGIHALALRLNRNYSNVDIAWTWNTSLIEGNCSRNCSPQ